MHLDPDVIEHMSLISHLTHADLWAMDAQTLECLAKLQAAVAPVEPPHVAIREDIAPGPHGPVPVRIYTPPGGGHGLRPGLVWLHGGGFVVGDLDMAEGDYPSRVVCSDGSAVVISVEYRLVTEDVKYPVPHDDVLAAWQWVRANSEQLGIDPDSLSLGGASAGANLAAGVAVRLRDQNETPPAKLILVYPAVHPELPPLPSELVPSFDMLPTIWRFPPALITQLWENYLGGPVSSGDQYAFPGSGDVSGLPPTRILTSEYDDLRTSGEAFADQLGAAGIDVELVCETGVPHGHLNYPALAGTERSLQVLTGWVSEPAARRSSSELGA